jgi:hypothetical protein
MRPATALSAGAVMTLIGGGRHENSTTGGRALTPSEPAAGSVTKTIATAAKGNAFMTHLPLSWRKLPACGGK